MGSRGLRGAGLGEPRTRVASQPYRRTYQRSRMSTVDVCGLGPDGDACAVRVSPSCSMPNGPWTHAGERAARRARLPCGRCVVLCRRRRECYPSPAPGYVCTSTLRCRSCVQHEIVVYSRANVIRLSNNGATGGDAGMRVRATRRTWPRVSRPPSGSAGPCPTHCIPTPFQSGQIG
jgi:hypothetical protein